MLLRFRRGGSFKDSLKSLVDIKDIDELRELASTFPGFTGEIKFEPCKVDEAIGWDSYCVVLITNDYPVHGCAWAYSDGTFDKKPQRNGKHYMSEPPKDEETFEQYKERVINDVTVYFNRR